MSGLLAGIEAGGTKFVLGTAEAPGRPASRHVIPTTDPEQTLDTAARWLAAQGEIAAIGIASFGPVAVDRADERWGHILETPKSGWKNCDLAGFFARAFDVPVGLDTDVNGAALGEWRFGAGEGAGSLAYVTVGTGIGGGFVSDGRTLGGAGHPEMGHVHLKRPAADDGWPGRCPYHGDCVEGLASGPAIMERWGATLSELPVMHEAHRLVADYLGQFAYAIQAMTGAEVLVMGGGVMKTPGLLDAVQTRAKEIAHDYLPGGARQRICAPALDDDAGIAGALCLAEAALG